MQMLSSMPAICVGMCQSAVGMLQLAAQQVCLESRLLPARLTPGKHCPGVPPHSWMRGSNTCFCQLSGYPSLTCLWISQAIADSSLCLMQAQFQTGLHRPAQLRHLVCTVCPAACPAVVPAGASAGLPDGGHGETAAESCLWVMPAADAMVISCHTQRQSTQARPAQVLCMPAVITSTRTTSLAEARS